MKSLAELTYELRARPHYEPVKRNKDGLRWIRHRFPIKGGISEMEVIVQELVEKNAFLRAFVRQE